MAIANELTINATASALDLAQTIFGEGITVVSAAYSGDPTSVGIYSGALSTIPGIVPSDSGVILSTGNVTNFTNASGTTDTNTASTTGTDQAGGVDGDTQLNTLAGEATFDGAILSADFIPTGDMLTMQFVFSSEEYPEYANAGVNDSFGVWVNGQFVEATISIAGNISIDTVNQTSNQNLYRDNTADQFNTEMDGFTYVLSFKAPVTAGQVNTIKIGVADGGDAIYDSNLLIMGDSIQTFALAMDDTLQLTPNSSRTFDILANDRDLSNGGLTITHLNGTAVVVGQTVTLATGEQVRLNAGGTVTVFSDADVGTNALTYSIVDSEGNTDVGYVFVKTVATAGPDGIVEGTAGADAIDGRYLGDPDGDMVDANDGLGVFGTVGDDDYIMAGAGNDLVTSGAANDIIYAGTGDDTVFGGGGDDWADLGAGNDSYGTYGADSAGNDTIYGGAGDDSVTGGAGNDALNAGSGNDSASMGAGQDTVDGGAGNDTLYGGTEADSLLGGDGADLVDGGAGDDLLYGDAPGQDTVPAPGTFTFGLFAINSGGMPIDNWVTYVNGTSTFNGGADVTMVSVSDDETGFEDYGAGGNSPVDGGAPQLLTAPITITKIVSYNAGVPVYGDVTFPAGTPIYAVAQSDITNLTTGEAGNAWVIQIGSDNTNIFYGYDIAVHDGDQLNWLSDNGGAQTPMFADVTGLAYSDLVMADGQPANDNDTLSGGAGNDLIHGNIGDDDLDGGSGNDTLLGDDGADSLLGGDDRDLIFGGIDDVVDGGEGGDDFDTLDLSAWGHAATNILYDVNNPENGTVEFLDPGGNVIGTMTFSNIEAVVACFTPGAMILTDQGEIAVEDLQPGDRVLTRDHGYQPIRWVGRRDLTAVELLSEPRFNPVSIAAGALGAGMPHRDMLVSPQHRILITGARSELLFGEHEILVAAKHLVGQAGITQRLSSGVSYLHILFDAHEIVRADGAWSESFQPGAQTLNGMEDGQRAEIMALFPELHTNIEAFSTARLALKGREARVLIGA